MNRRVGPLNGIVCALVPRVKPEDKNWVPAFAGMTPCGRKLAFRTLVRIREDDRREKTLLSNIKWGIRICLM